MEIEELQKLAKRNRQMKEIGIALVAASALLAIFLFVPLKPQAKTKNNPTVTIATTTEPNAFANVPIEAKAAIVYDLATKKVLFAKNSNAQLPLASLTKLLTVYSAVSTFATSTVITIPENIAGMYPPHAFTPGQTFTLNNLARLTLTASLNDGAESIAEATASYDHRSTSATLALAASALGLQQTYAVNGNGLDVNTALSGGYGSAYDLARLAGALVEKVPGIVSATTQLETTATATNGLSFTVKNTDPFVKTIPGLLLSKTGYTDLAGGNLALVFNVGLNHPIAVVVLGSTEDERFTDGKALVAATFADFANVPSL